MCVLWGRAGKHIRLPKSGEALSSLYLLRMARRKSRLMIIRAGRRAGVLLFSGASLVLVRDVMLSYTTHHITTIIHLLFTGFENPLYKPHNLSHVINIMIKFRNEMIST